MLLYYPFDVNILHVVYSCILLLFVRFIQIELQEVKEDLNEKTQLLETRDADLKMLHKQLVDSEEQMKNELQIKEAEWNNLRENYHKVCRSFFTFSTILLRAH